MPAVARTAASMRSVWPTLWAGEPAAAVEGGVSGVVAGGGTGGAGGGSVTLGAGSACLAGGAAAAASGPEKTPAFKTAATGRFRDRHRSGCPANTTEAQLPYPVAASPRTPTAWRAAHCGFASFPPGRWTSPAATFATPGRPRPPSRSAALAWPCAGTPPHAPWRGRPPWTLLSSPSDL